MGLYRLRRGWQRVKRDNENGIGAMSAKERTAARGVGINWEDKYAEFKRCVEMPKKGTKLCIWQQNELGKGAASLNARIRKELGENKRSTVWSERRVKLFDCVTKEKVSRLQCKIMPINCPKV